MAVRNLATKYSKAVDERFYRESQVMMALNNDYKFTGVQTVAVYSLPVAPMNDYQRSGMGRYGTADDLVTNIQNLTIRRDRSFTFTIDRGDKIQSEMVLDAGKALTRQIREVCVPEFDTYVLKALAAAATARGSYGSEAIDKKNAYELFLAGMEHLGNHNVPDKGRVCFCSYKFANYLKQDPSFMKYGDKSQEMLLKGVIGEVDGCKIVKVPATRLPAGAAFLITHPSAACAPKQLTDYKIHDNPPGVSGWLVEGRMIYDAFVLNNKADAIYYHGSQPVLKNLIVGTFASDSNKSTVQVLSEMEGSTRWYVTAATFDALPDVTFGTAIDSADGWKTLGGSSAEIVPTSGHTAIRVVEVNSANEPIAEGSNVLNIG